MITGTGIDAVYIPRVKKLNSSFINKYFSKEEVKEYEGLSSAHEDIRYQYLASRFAVKEAYAKAHGTGFCEEAVPCEITTCKDENGKPYIKLSGNTAKCAGECRIHVSLTHEESMAIAMVIIERIDG